MAKTKAVAGKKWLLKQLEEVKEKVEAAAEEHKKSAGRYAGAIKIVFAEYSGKAKEFDDGTVVVGYKRVSKVAILQMEPEKVAMSRG